MEQSKPKARRCAVYTRKSSEEGLEQNFNSLHAQREACEAFIKSQTSEGWKLVKTAYDDGGLSGGTMERPALKRLLADIDEGLVDVVVVYKVDRLTRSLADFAKMVELFDAHGISFVAVTQQFNTTTSMGRLTLNVLLSFAQFERGTSNRSITSPLAGKLFDVDGQPLYVQGATKGRRRYRYYVSKYLVNGSARDKGKGWRLSAPELERAVAIAARHILSDRAGLLEALEKSGIDSPDVRATLESASNCSRRLQNEADTAAALVEIVSKVEMRDDGITVTLRIEVQCSRAGLRTSSNLDSSRFVPLRMKRRGVETRIIIAAGDDLPRKVDPALLKAGCAFEGVV